MIETMRNDSASGSLALGSDEAERIDLPPYRLLDPVLHVFSLEALTRQGPSPRLMNHRPVYP
jgi:hypothetical protein